MRPCHGRPQLPACLPAYLPPRPRPAPPADRDHQERAGGVRQQRPDDGRGWVARRAASGSRPGWLQRRSLLPPPPAPPAPHHTCLAWLPLPPASAVLFMVAQGITSTGGADFIITKLLGTPRDTMLAQVRWVRLVGRLTMQPALRACRPPATRPCRGARHTLTRRAAALGLGWEAARPIVIRVPRRLPRSACWPQVRMCLITALFSSFVNDTPVFCIMMPIVMVSACLPPWAPQAPRVQPWGGRCRAARRAAGVPACCRLHPRLPCDCAQR